MGTNRFLGYDFLSQVANNIHVTTTRKPNNWVRLGNLVTQFDGV